MVNQIKAKAQLMKEENEKQIDATVRMFDQKAKQQFDEIFRETKYDTRKKERLSIWKNKKYTKKTQL